MKRTTVLFLLLLSVISVFGWDDRFVQYDVTRGLSNDRARFIVSMPDHRILVGVEGMLSLYDGSRFQNLQLDRSKSVAVSNPIDINYFFDKQGILWIRGNEALYALDTRSYTFLSAPELLSPAKVSDKLKNFFIDSEGSTWLFTDKGGLYLYDWQKPARKFFQLPKLRIDASYIWVMDVVRQGDLVYILSSDGMMTVMSVSSRRTLYKKAFSPVKQGYRVRAMAVNRHTIFLRLVKGLVAYDTQKRQFHDVDTTFNAAVLRPDGKGGVWAVGMSGISHYDSQLRQTVKEMSVLNQWNIPVLNGEWQDAAVDWQGGLWLCSRSSGVLYSAQGHRIDFFQSLPFGNGMRQNNNVLCIAKGDDNRLWLGTSNGLLVYDIVNGAYSSASPVFSGTRIVDLSFDGQGLLWVSTARDGLFSLDVASGKVTAYNPSNGVMLAPNMKFCKEISPGVFFICAHNNLIGLLYPATKKYIELEPGSARQLDNYRSIVDCCPMAGGLLVGTNNGFFFFDPMKRSIDTTRCRVLNDNTYNISCKVMYRDHNGMIWIGTQDGLLCYDSNKNVVRRYDEHQGLNNTFVIGITEDADGYLWITTADGLSFLNKSRDYVHFLHNSYEAGSPTEHFSEKAIVSDEQGRVWIGTSNGTYLVDARRLTRYRFALVPHLMDISVLSPASEDGSQQYVSVFSRLDNGKIKLSHRENYLRLSVSVLNYLYPNYTIYRYRLDGVDKGWLSADDRRGGVEMVYAALPPGHYTLHVEASMLGTSWSPDMTLSIIVRPPFWATWWAYLIYALALAVVVVLALRVYLNNRRQKMEAERHAAEVRDKARLAEMKFRFFTNISHEFRTPLTLIITPLQTLLERKDLPKDVEKILNVIKRNAQSLNSLVSQLLDFRSLEQNGETLQPTAVQLSTFFASLEPTFGPMAESHGITFEIDDKGLDNAPFYLDVPKMQKVLGNLLSNAFKFTPAGGKVTVSATLTSPTSNLKPQSSNLKVVVSDTGVGMKQEDLKHIFDRFYQADNEAQGEQLNTGSGIGLNIVKGYVDLHHGTISVESEEGKGTSFTVTIPDNIPESEKERIKRQQEAEKEDKEEQIEDDGKVKLIIVEDNVDFREFMVDQLKDDYRVFAAANGEEALSTIRVTQPDIIISDVMMPKMDGYELTKAVKGDVRLSHIPVVLLTAKNTDEGRAEGYQSGADAYITKPFNMSVLQACVTMLLDQRRKRHEEFEKEAEVNPKKLTITPVDEKFLKKAVECMEKNMSKEDYDVVAFSSDLAMERSTLYRKMVAVVGKTPLQFMHSMRMKRAAQLLQTGEYPVADVAVMVGFSSTKYFSQNFKKEYGVLPSKYGKDFITQK